VWPDSQPFTTQGTGTHTFTPAKPVNNAVVIGANTQVTEPDRIQLGTNAVTYTRVGVGPDRLIPVTELKALAAASADYAAFQSAISSLPS
jgi:hypothetical protein